jgi:hypothetical protein
MGKQGKTSGKDCKSIQDVNEKMKCFEEFYNEMSGRYTDFEDKMISEAIDSRTGEKISAEEEKQRKLCKDKGMGTILEYKNGKRIVICVDKNNPNINNGGQKCPDGVCDDYEMSHPYSCPQDCGGESMNYQQPMQQNYMQSQAQCPQGNRMQCDNNGKCFCINEQAQQDFGEMRRERVVCSGQAPNCAPNGPPFCDNGNWRCPQMDQQQKQQPVNRIDQPQQPQQQPQQTQTNPAPGPGASYPSGDNQQHPAPVPGTENPPASSPSTPTSGGGSGGSSEGGSAPAPGPGASYPPSNSGGGSAPVTGGVIGGDNAFLNFYFGK